MIVVIDYGLGNLKSICNMFSHINVKAVVSSEPEAICRADKIVLPGVGSYDTGVVNLKQSGLIEVLNHEVMRRKKPVLGICLGMQLMTESSEEGKEYGLGWFKAQTRKFKFPVEGKMKVPHMGWNVVSPVSCSTLFKGFEGCDSRFYFVHSYFVDCSNKVDVLAKCVYGDEFACAIAKENIYGVQFHPEKSHKFGMKLLKNFAEM